MFDLKQFRDRAGLTQLQLATRLNVTQVQISRFEASPQNVPIGMIQQYMSALGLDLLAEMNKKQDNGSTPDFAFGHPYCDLQAQFKPMVNYLKDLSEEGNFPRNLLLRPGILINAIQQATRKPKVLITGRFDAGKSHLANYLIGKRCLPTNYQPETKVPIFIRHIKDRPSFIQEDVWVLGPEFNPKLWNVREHVTEHKKIGGNFFTLKDWASHSGDKTTQQVGAALVFVDAPILEGCDLIDLPGDLHNEEDQQVATLATTGADVVLYASSAKGFLDGHDLVRIQSIEQSLKVQGPHIKHFQGINRMAVVATHSDPSINDKMLHDIVKRGETRLKEELGFGLSDEQKAGFLRTFTFWEETTQRNQDLIIWLNEFLGRDLPQLAKDYALKTKSDYLQGLEKWQTSQINLLQSYGDRSKRHSEDDDKLRHRQVRRQEIIDEIETCRTGQEQAIKALFKNGLKVRFLVQRIKQKFPQKEAAHQFAAAHIVNGLQVQANEGVQTRMNNLGPKIKRYMDSIPHPVLRLEDDMDVIADLQETKFNARGFLLGGAAGLASLGPLATWASQLGPWGGYLVFAEGASALGFGSAGASTLVSMVVAVGGPSVVAAATIVAGAVIGASFIGRNWQLKLAEQVMTNIKKSGLEDKMLKTSHQHWDQVLLSFKEGSAWLERDSQQRFEQIDSILDSPDAENQVKALILSTNEFIKKISKINDI